MAAEDQVVRITYQELKEIVDARESVKIHRVGKDDQEKMDGVQSPQSKRQNKNRRPAQALYRPGHLRQGSEARNDGVTDSGSKSKEGSVEKQVADLSLESAPKEDSGYSRQSSVQKNIDLKKRSKRPEVQIYKPRIKNFDRGDTKSEEGESSSCGAQLENATPKDVEDCKPLLESQTYESGGGGSLPRRVHVKSQEGRMQVTVKNSDGSRTSSQVLAGGGGGRRRNEGSNNNRGRGGEDDRSNTDKNMRDFRRSGGSNSQDNRNAAAAAYKSYRQNRRSNSIESLHKEKEEGSSGNRSNRKEGYNYSSETFPRAKSGANKSKAMTSNREMTNSSSGRDGDKLYLGVTRQRTGSISSEASAASFNSNGSFYSGSSDWCTEEEEPEHIADWGAEVEKAHLEELARLVHHGAQELTSSLNTYEGEEKENAVNGQVSSHMSTSQPNVFSEKLQPATEKNIRNRSKRRHRRRKTSSQYSSRDSSVHSSVHGEDDNMSERSGYSMNSRRRRRRHHSGRSQSGRQEEEGGGGGSGRPQSLQVTIGGGQNNNRFVEVNRDAKPNQHHHQFVKKDQYQHQHAPHAHRQDVYGSGREGRGRGGGGGNFTPEGHNERQQMWDKDVPPRFRKDSDGGGDSSALRVGKGRGRGSTSRSSLPPEGERSPGFQRDRRSEDPAHDETTRGNSSRYGNHGRGRVVHNNRRGSWDDSSERLGSTTTNRNTNTKQMPSKKDNKDKHESSQHHHHHNQGIIHLPSKVTTSHPQSEQQPQLPHQQQSFNSSGATATTSSNSNVPHSSYHNPHHHQHLPTSSSTIHPSMAAATKPSNTNSSRGPIQGQKQLFDPNNPSKPILIPGKLQPQQPQQPTSPTVVPNFQDPEGFSLSPSPGSTAGLALSPSPDNNRNSPNPPYQPHPQPPPPPMFYPSPMYPGFRPPMMPPFPPQGPYPMGPGPFPQGTVPPHVFYRFPGMAAPDMAPFYNSDMDSDGNGSSRAQCHMMAEQILRDSSPFESQLGNILSRRPLTEDSERMLNQMRFDLQNRLEQVILLDVEVANKRNVEQTLWKSVYYQVIEAHRKRMAEQPGDKGCKDRLLEVLSEGHRFFENLLQKLQTTHRFDLDVYTDGNRAVPEVANRNVKLALLSAQRVMMFLGDIARYKEQVADTANYGKARNLYLKAQKLHPRNGRPYNQLAILAVYTKRKLDAVYYYMRSLAASNPIMTARESLMSLFDEVRRKVEVVEKKRLDERRQCLERHRKRKTMGARLEIWYTPDGVRTQDTVDEKEEEDLSALSAVELNKRFVLTYLNVHGKLFTKINFEGFAESSSLMLLEFETLLQHSPCVMSSTRLLQLMGINMFSIDNTALKDESLEASCRSVLQEHAVQIGLEMFGLLVKRASDLLSSQMEKEKKAACRGNEEGGGGGMKLDLEEDLHQMLPALKTWVDWMMCHAQLWNPQPFNRPPELGPDVDVWLNLARLCDLLNSLDKGQMGVTRQQMPDMDPVVLLEDSMLAGFVPMLSAPQEVFYVDKSTDKTQAEDWLRMEKLSLFGEYLCGVEPPMLSFDVDSNSYKSVAPQQLAGEETMKGGCDKEESLDEYDDVEIEPHSEEEGVVGDEPEDSIQRLKMKKAELSKKRLEQEKNKESMEAILASHRHAKIELEIHPIFLIPDTNCFIDHFSTLKAILHSKKFTLVVPLVVINELDGLARGSRADQYASADHAQMVKKQATAAIACLEEEFERKHPNLRAQTSKGSILETIAFRSEEASNEGINDDIILSCCLHYCKDKAREFMPKSKDSAVRLYREVVLLTEDRNLRLKAHTCNVPVQDVPSFKKWSKIR